MKKSLLLTFWLLVVNFLVIVYGMFSIKRKITLIAMLPFLFLGIALIFLTLRQKIKGPLKKFLLLTGISTVGFLISAVLHNLIYAMFKGYFDKTAGGDEVVFFALAVFVCPIAFCIGAIGSIVSFIKTKKNDSKFLE